MNSRSKTAIPVQRRPKGSAKRALLLDVAEKLILKEGYAAANTRRVALEAGIKPPLVHYYFPTTEDLLLAVYQRAAEEAHGHSLEAFGDGKPLEAFWKQCKESAHTGLGTEFYALANHRKLISSEIARTAVDNRKREAETLSQTLGERLDRNVCTPMGLIVLILGISRLLTMEKAVGVTMGHAEAMALIDWLLQRVQKSGKGSREKAPAAPAGRRRAAAPSTNSPTLRQIKSGREIPP
jgi:AcrR family transcriptional regulator